MWFIYALFGAVGKSYSGFFRKKIAKTVSGSMYLWIGYTLMLLVLSPFMLSRGMDIFNLLTQLPLILFGAALTNVIATQLNLEALKREDLSYTAPLNAFVPVFTLGIAIVFLNERPPGLGVIGIIAVVVGAYIVSIRPERTNWYDPLTRLLTSAGAQLSLAVAFFYAVNSVLVKAIANNGYDPITIVYVTTLLGWLLLINVPLSKRDEFRAIKKSDRFSILAGSIASFASNFFHILALANTLASYATSVRRLDAVFSVLLGWRYLKEKSIRMKLIGSLVMTAGAIVMVLS